MTPLLGGVDRELRRQGRHCQACKHQQYVTHTHTQKHMCARAQIHRHRCGIVHVCVFSSRCLCSISARVVGLSRHLHACSIALFVCTHSPCVCVCTQPVSLANLDVTGGFLDPLTGGGVRPTHTHHTGASVSSAAQAVYLVFDNTPPLDKLAAKVRIHNGVLPAYDIYAKWRHK